MLYIVAIGWMFVVVLMAVVEAVSPNGTVLGALFTFLLYGLLPLGLVLYLLGTPLRAKQRQTREAQEAQEAQQD
jgi:membrane protein implicated in regulation of membrane protease activity